ncbi:PREDICTED: IQ domain-containing protein E [Elephantulus edwardii]|uniref:IQ domain-containing protein E n=1 Tax=Elephantulus edwardii TaxID=28737 RepID=UPI0003F07C36|nr:PREDICTED: IQ domain-containing protein E [Elephantulus edwardii]
MSLGPEELASDTGDDSLSTVTLDSSFETKAKRKSSHKPPPTSPKSPYYSRPQLLATARSLRMDASMPLNTRMTLTPQKLWLGTSKQGSLTQPLKADHTLEQAWTTPPRCTSDYLTEALRIRGSRLRRSASHGRVSGTPTYKEKEDMYDEIMELKKSLHLHKRDMDLLRTKLRRLEEENSRKDRQIEQLLDPGRGPDFIRTLMEKRPDTGWVVNGLKQKILKLEQQCKEKDSTISKLQSDMKTTNLEEMRIAMETYYEEIQRLQTLLASSDVSGKKLPAEKKVSLKRQKKMNVVLLNLSRSVQELTDENQSLKEDLDRVLSNSPSSSKVKGYMEWSKPRLLRRVSELEKKIALLESSKLNSSELVKSCPVTHASASPSAPRQPRADQQEGPKQLHSVLKSLRGERATLHTQLQEKDLEVEQLLQTKADLEKELELVKERDRERRGQEEALRELVQTLTKKLQDLEDAEKDKIAGPTEPTHEKTCWLAEPQAMCKPPRGVSFQKGPPAREIQEDPWEPHTPSSCSPQTREPDTSAACSRPPSVQSAGSREDKQRDTAARLLQAWWRTCHKKKAAVLDEAATVLQAAFRGHLARTQLLVCTDHGSPRPSTPSPSWKHPTLPGSRSPAALASTGLEEAATLIQAVFRAHLARTRPGRGPGQLFCLSQNSGSEDKYPHSRPEEDDCPRARDDSEASSTETLEGSAAEQEAWSTAAAPSLLQMLPALSRPQPSIQPPTDEVGSDDSDDVVIAPSLPRKHSAS